MAELADGGIDAVLSIDEDFAGPEALGDFGAGDELTFAGGEEDEQLHRLAFDAQRFAVAQQLKAAAVKLEVAELVKWDRARAPGRLFEDRSHSR